MMSAGAKHSTPNLLLQSLMLPSPRWQLYGSEVMKHILTQETENAMKRQILKFVN